MRASHPSFFPLGREVLIEVRFVSTKGTNVRKKIKVKEAFNLTIQHPIQFNSINNSGIFEIGRQKIKEAFVEFTYSLLLLEIGWIHE